MSLRAFANAAVQGINPDVKATLRQSNGYTTAADGSRTPAYNTTSGMVQVQSISAKDLRHLEGQNITGDLRKVYLDNTCEAAWNAGVRAALQGGDLFEFDEAIWLAVKVAEVWADWSAVIVVRQVKP